MHCPFCGRPDTQVLTPGSPIRRTRSGGGGAAAAATAASPPTSGTTRARSNPQARRLTPAFRPREATGRARAGGDQRPSSASSSRRSSTGSSPSSAPRAGRRAERVGELALRGLKSSTASRTCASPPSIGSSGHRGVRSRAGAARGRAATPERAPRSSSRGRLDDRSIRFRGQARSYPQSRRPAPRLSGDR